jgi:hypothetical protein
MAGPPPSCADPHPAINAAPPANPAVDAVFRNSRLLILSIFFPHGTG